MLSRVYAYTSLIVLLPVINSHKKRALFMVELKTEQKEDIFRKRSNEWWSH